MKAITIRQPWAWLIAEGLKPIENRSRNFARKHAGERIAIHVSLHIYEAATVDALGLPHQRRRLFREMDDQCGRVIATARLDRIIEHGDGDPLNEHRFRTQDRFGIVLADVVKLSEPVRAKGALGLWTVPEHLAAVVNEQEEAARAATRTA